MLTTPAPTVLAVLLSSSCLLLSGCREDRQLSGAKPDQDMMVSCSTPLANGDRLVSSCDYDLTIDGRPRGRTHVEYEVASARGASAAIQALAEFEGAEGRPSGGVLLITLTDDGYELDAGVDGKVSVSPAEIDPADPEAAIDQVQVTTTSGSGLTKMHTITCPGLFAFATDIEEQGDSTMPPMDGCDPNASIPDPMTGCFPCEALENLLFEEGFYLDPDLRVRSSIAHHQAAAIYAEHGSSERAEIVLAIVSVIATIITKVWDTGVDCNTSIGDGVQQNCSTRPNM